MDIEGLQKLTLLDYPGKVACTVFLGGCNLRCPFCHNSELVVAPAPAQLDDEELISFLRTRKGLLDGVCITGGEPLLRPGLMDLLKKIRAEGFLIKLDTNGAYPDRLKELVGAGLVDYVAMDVKNSPGHYAETVGCPQLDLDPFKESVDYLLSGPVDYEFRTTVVKEFHKEEDFVEIGKLIRGAKRYFLQSFVDRDTVLQSGLHAYSREELTHFSEVIRPFVHSVELRGV